MLLFLRLKEVKKKEEVRKQEIKKGKMGAGGLVSANQRLCIPFVPPLRFKYITCQILIKIIKINTVHYLKKIL